MTAETLLSSISQLVFLILGIATTLDYFRNRDRIRRDIALMFISIAVPTTSSLLNSFIDLPDWVGTLAVLPLLAQPYLIIRLIQYLRTVPRYLSRFALGGMIAAFVIFLIFTLSTSQLPQAISLIIVVYFVILDGYAMLAFTRGALATSGVVGQRLRFAAAGSGLLALALGIAGLSGVVPALRSIAAIAIQLLAVASALGYYIGFVPPRALRRMWQFAELRDFLTAIGNSSPIDDSEASRIFRELGQAAHRAIGGKTTIVLERRAEDETWRTMYSSRDQVFDLTGINQQSVVYQAWENKASHWLTESTPLADPDRRLLEMAEADTLVIAPITVADTAVGIVLVFLQSSSLFPSDDLELLRLLAQQGASFVENNQLIEQMRRYSEELEQRVEERTAALRESEGRYHRIIDNMMEGFQILGFDWRYLYVNDAAAQFGRVEKGDLLGHILTEKYPGIEHTEMFASMKQSMEKRISQIEEFEFAYPDGDQAWFRFSIQPVPEGISILSLEITERKRAEAALLRINEDLEQRVTERTSQLQATNKELEAFSYSVSHDLRAPLRAIDGFSQALLEDYQDKLDEEGQDYLTLVRKESQRMGELIDDLLDLSRLTRTEPKREGVNLSVIAQEIAAELRTQDPNREVEFVIEDDLSVCADPRLMRIVLHNLLGNAWKYSSKQPDAQIVFGSQREQEHTVYFVRDNGIGFDMDYVHKLFGAFQRLHSVSEFEGTGIGLATVQRIILRHGGFVRAEGAINEGATFYYSVGQDSCD